VEVVVEEVEEEATVEEEEATVEEEVSDVVEVQDQEDPTYLSKTKPEKRELSQDLKALRKSFDQFILKFYYKLLNVILHNKMINLFIFIFLTK
jgi:hypothetical protein